MEKDLVKLLIAEYQQKLLQVEFNEREYNLEDNLNYVFVGLRRAGKSYLMYRQAAYLLKNGHSNNENLYFNFEDDRIATLTTADLDLIKVCYEEMYDRQPIFFLDEIQIVPYWEKFVRRLVDQKYRVYVTGSNAKMLSSEIATTLGGRFVVQDVYPYSFREYLISQNLNVNDKNLIPRHNTTITKSFERYFRYGGLPEITRVNDKRAWMSSLYQKIIFGDLVSRYKIRNDYALRVLIRKLAESVKQPTSFNRLAHVVSASGKKITTDTVIDYIGYLKESWLIFSIENVEAKLADKETHKKYYFADNGILNLFLMDPVTALLENLVAIYLKRMYGDDVYYYAKGIEVDFYLLEAQIAVQVSYSLKDSETRKREITALLKLADRLPAKKLFIITKEEEETIVQTDKTIEVLPAWKILLNGFEL